MEKKSNIGKDFFILSVLTVITITVWIVIDVYQSLNKSETPSVSDKQLAPLNQKLEISILDDLEKRDFYDLNEYQPVPTAGIETSPLATPEAQTP